MDFQKEKQKKKSVIQKWKNPVEKNYFCFYKNGKYVMIDLTLKKQGKQRKFLYEGKHFKNL